MNYLVTGGAGFIGSHIVEELVRNGERVRILDNFSTGKRENVETFRDKIEMIEGDIRDYHTVREALEGIDIVLHQAAVPSVPRSIIDPVTTNDVNINGALNILRGAKEATVRRVVYASSSSVYGDSRELPKHEEMPTNPLSPYAVSKLTGEKYCVVFSHVYGLETISLRYFNVFGPRQDPDSQYSAVIPKFIKAMMSDASPVIYGDGTQSRDFTYVDNVVRANIQASTAHCNSGVVLNCASESQITVNELVSLLNKILGKNIEALYDEPRRGDIKHSFASLERARETIGYSPVIDFRRGLEKTVNWYLSQES